MQRRRFGREFKIEAVRLIRERGVSLPLTPRRQLSLRQERLSSMAWAGREAMSGTWRLRGRWGAT